ncbi:hypothetical protein A2697_00400 [Candidatus Curtissbacteria bacterium RIFCSPHIGHO2_01_FULL_41_44]|uniref:PIN domain-containing protein n=1 Tax=Candidatus Curtissbacteria bacterium RIFCSPLOWO2_01_FULL_42_50 TaxID=1797730 RepID=A0A1F5H4L7_9BACT|nr:MAG: hypothetical protein A2697_00400 [Candidatus Curtissbacteria bacterium RIFCSPHIGHO2_01_FULL_41_44]OGD93582.1 MAG: hypothetical protein A3C33_01540 [Candidatus Curtissbacteria bacterium RIFCSPHIGHO2_02_FULL_42_58]OGD97169.1 MAG: hypothetical protein A3E71_04975 [Candidatus Curtissbacteria bacterium RIFCSPHIGHO2_12_FULL_42_33]OGD99083.1 MAG: hypothetical protein A3B54_05220 [Candidatus Curtissbacteria bacterium RIFCSPLOWO2_01_FULL_42_50]OGE02284.1 MAG: hypothetical protein A3G16_01315 [Ca
MIFVDTNFFLRFLLEDIDDQYLEAKQLFLEGAQAKATLVTSTIVFFEIYWVLHSFYGRKKKELIAILVKILSMTFIILEERTVLTESLNLFQKTNFSLEDCYNLSYAKDKSAKDFKSFDVKLAKFF